jgi:hypothetical protein
MRCAARLLEKAMGWEETLSGWAKVPSQSSQEKCENAERMVRKAIAASETLGERTIEVFAQGSYRNRTNVRQESDVDICVRCMDPFFCDFALADGATESDAGLVDGTYAYGEFKNEVGDALISYFGKDGVTRGDKAFDIHENTYRVDADVVACFEHRRYMRDGSGNLSYLSGTEFRPDRGGQIINWPHQHYENGVAKNVATGKRFKAGVRMLKRLRNKMADEGIAQAGPIASYLIECLVWNVPNEGFGHDTYVADMRYILVHTFNATLSDDACKEWGEVNELKYLFCSGQPWSRQQAHAFLAAAWDYLGFS